MIAPCHRSAAGRRRSWLALLAALVGAAALAAGSRPLLGGAASPAGDAGRTGAWLGLGLLAALLGVGLAIVAVGRPALLRRARAGAPLAAPWWQRAVALAAVLAALSLGAIALLVGEGSRPAPGPSPSAPAGAPAPSAPAAPKPGGAGPPWPAVVLALAGLGAFGGALLWAWRGRARPRAATAGSQHPLSTAAAAGRAALDASLDDRTAILAAYEAMRQVLAARGVPARASDAPRELLERATADAAPATRRPMEILTGVFERARFSTAPVAAAERRAAESALESLLREIGAEPC